MKKTIMFLGMLSLGLAHAQQNDPYEGKVGVNTETPSATLNVKSKTGGVTTATKNLQLESSDGTQLLTVLNNGNLGIRVESPDDHMNIRNQIRFNWEKRALGIGIAAGVSSWNRGYNFTTTDGATNFGGFSAYGDNNTLNYFFIGQDYRYPIIKFDATTKNVGIGINGYNIAPADKLHIAEGNVRISDLPNNVGSTTDKIVVVDTNGVLKSLDKAEANKEQEWVFDATANRINLRRSGDVAGTFKNKIFYNAETGQYVDIDNEKSMREILFKSTGNTLGFIERDLSLEDSKNNTKHITHTESANLPVSTATNSKGVTSLYKRLLHQSMVVTETDTTPNYSTYNTSITIPSANAKNYTNVYGGNTNISLFGTGTLANSYATSGQVNIGNSQNVTGFVSGVLATAAINTSGDINAVYALQARNYYYNPNTTTKKITRSASGDFITYMPLDDYSLIVQNMGISNKLINASKNSGNGTLMAGIYNEVEQLGSTKYTNQYGILTKSLIKGTVAPDNHYGIYIDNVEGGTNNNYSLYTGVGKVHLGDDVEVIGNLKVRPKVVTTNTCGNTEAGTIRFDATAKKFQGCTGTEWKDLHN